MLLSYIKFSPALGALSALGHCLPTTTSTSSISIPTPTYLFTAELYIGNILTPPIPLLEGGSVTIEPLVNGTVKGPALNGTIYSGFAAATVVSNNTVTGNNVTVQVPSIYVYGETSDGLPFYVQETGVGPIAGQNTRLQIAVGGKHSSLQTAFIIAQPSINMARTKVTVPCFSIPLAPGIA
ncbi:hypothetical protein PFICI_05834 [Pestalotiopsis fici W106-1]|uniref:Uncharacterized protein n=1 Tax=Pestalotiopsis fici (strain W106-1 / CGMCC3.15140) TaxID=1229662 RepID=W3XCY0_PESFW|nr:uncharacterized protein PFICI_05834 [Pestalotiopsis fici W106-1]ETS83958.1 hypothetical protein PFICI_05834 [Pestalotiopsis fici W106-1]